MATSALRERLNQKLDELSAAELEAVLRYVEVMTTHTLPDDYDPDNDPAVGFFSASPDLASRTKSILRSEFGQARANTDETE